MKIIFVSNISWSLFNFRRALMTEIKNRGHEVVFCAARDDYTPRLEQMGFRYIPITLERKGTNILKDLFLFFSLISIYRKEKPEWVFHNSIKPNIYGAIAAYFAGTRCVNTVSGLGYLFIKGNFLSDLIRMPYMLASACAKKTFFQNKDDMQLFLDNRLIRPDKCAFVAGSGVNADFFKPRGDKNIVSGKGKFVFLYMGRILWDKGIGELVEAVRLLKKKHPSAKVNLLGMVDRENPAGVRYAQIKKWEGEGLVAYLGEALDVRPYLENSDCVVLPSYREGISKTLLEASAMELPVIATDVPGCRQVIERDVTGFLVKVRDAASLAEAMDKVVGMTEEQRKEMGQKGRAKIIREYSENSVIGTYCSQIGLFKARGA